LGTLRGKVLSVEHFDDPLEDFKESHRMKLLLGSHTRKEVARRCSQNLPRMQDAMKQRDGQNCLAIQA
jgi:hypothetical protein